MKNNVKKESVHRLILGSLKKNTSKYLGYPAQTKPNYGVLWTVFHDESYRISFFKSLLSEVVGHSKAHFLNLLKCPYLIFKVPANFPGMSFHNFIKHAEHCLVGKRSPPGKKVGKDVPPCCTIKTIWETLKLRIVHISLLTLVPPQIFFRYSHNIPLTGQNESIHRFHVSRSKNRNGTKS